MIGYCWQLWLLATRFSWIRGTVHQLVNLHQSLVVKLLTTSNMVLIMVHVKHHVQITTKLFNNWQTRDCVTKSQSKNLSPVVSVANTTWVWSVKLLIGYCWITYCPWFIGSCKIKVIQPKTPSTYSDGFRFPKVRRRGDKVQAYCLTNFFKKLHENEEMLVQREEASLAAPRSEYDMDTYAVKIGNGILKRFFIGLTAGCGDGIPHCRSVSTTGTRRASSLT